MKKSFYILLSIVALISFSSCDDTIIDTPSPREPVDDLVYTLLDINPKVTQIGGLSSKQFEVRINATMMSATTPDTKSIPIPPASLSYVISKENSFTVLPHDSYYEVYFRANDKGSYPIEFIYEYVEGEQKETRSVVLTWSKDDKVFHFPR